MNNLQTVIKETEFKYVQMNGKNMADELARLIVGPEAEKSEKDSIAEVIYNSTMTLNYELINQFTNGESE